MSLRKEVKTAVEEGRLNDVEKMIAEDKRAIRHALGHTYHPDDEIRATACRAIGLAGRYHKKLVKSVVRNLVWAMNEESGANALAAPQVIVAIAEETPELLLPMVPDLCRLAADEG